MALPKLVNGVAVEMAPAEESAFLAEQAAIAARKVVPASVTRFQALAALHNAGYLPQVKAILADAATPEIYRLAFDNALNFERDSAVLSALAGLLGLSADALDDLFIAAAGIKA